MKGDQFTFLYFRKVWDGFDWIGMLIWILIIIGRQSEESSEEVSHSDFKERSGLLKVTSVEVGWVLFLKGLRFGRFRLLMTVMFSNWLSRRDPLVSSLWEYSQDESWTIKSPDMIVFFGAVMLLMSSW